MRGVTGNRHLQRLACHELRLAWRDFHSMMTARRRWRFRTVLLVGLTIVAFLHLIAYGLVSQLEPGEPLLDKSILVTLTGTGLLAFAMMLSQAIESVTRTFYARGDLDLLLSSPIEGAAICAVRISTIALSSSLMTMIVAGPFINMAGWILAPGWLASYLVVAALGMAATAGALLVTVVLLRTIGARRTRLAAQIVAAVVGAFFVVGVQLAAVLSMEGFSRLALFRSDMVLSRAPEPGSPLWWPAHALAGDPLPLAVISGLGIGLLMLVIGSVARRFGPLVLAASAASTLQRGRVQTRAQARQRFTLHRAARTLRQKEWLLLRRDPWLVSQSLMQIFYLLPPALLLWLQLGSGTGLDVVVVPVLVVAAGQLAGGLAWLAVSGEDASDLIAGAPLRPGVVLRAKIEAVSGAVALFVLPIIILMALHSLYAALVAAVAVALSCASATAIQLWFRAQAKRSLFRYRQTTSRLAALTEAGATIAWAGTAGLTVWGSLAAIVPAGLAILVLFIAYALSPRASDARAARKKHDERRNQPQTLSLSPSAGSPAAAS